MALGIGAHAQYSYIGDFEDPGYNTTTYKQFGGGSRTTAAACNGVNGGQLAISSTVTQTGFMVDLSTISQSGNGQKVDVSVHYKKAATITGTLNLAYFIYNPEANNWSIMTFGTPAVLNATAITTCATLTGTIPSGSLQPGKVYGVGVWFVRSGTTTGNIFVDDINISQEVVTTPPVCASLTYPANGATVSGGNVNFQWNAVPTAVGYKLKVGTASGGNNILDIDVQGATHYDATIPVNGSYFASVTPHNLAGDATGCSEITFSTNSSISYCGPIVSTAPAATYPISSVAVNGGAAHTSSATVGSPAYEDFSSTVFNVTGANNMTLAVQGTGLGTNRFGMSVFVDWNNNGSFNDAGEQYFTTAPFVGGTGATVSLSGTIAVPDGITGDRRMRIKYNFNSSTTSVTTALSDPCGDIGNGQVEDYTLNITPPATAPACTTVTAPTEGSMISANTTFTWTAAPNASGYKLYLGTTAGGTEILNGTLVTGTSYSTLLTNGTTYYLKVVPTNSVGDAAGCTEVSFTAGPLSYCSPTPGYSTVEPTTNVTFAGINNTTSNVVGGTPAYEQFLNLTAQVVPGNSYPISLNANTDGASFRHFFSVFIDWNQDGDFNDAGEKYFTDAANFIHVLGSDGIAGTPATGTIAVPADAKFGVTRMRVKSAYYGTAGPNTEPNLTNWGNACVTTGSSFGQVEDYTVNVIDPSLAVSTANKDRVSVYPNPFHDVLKISDVKGVKSITITDVSGRTVKNMKPSTELNLSSLNAGLYIVTLHMEDGSVKTVKAIKK